jgi:hypothetical protein
LYGAFVSLAPEHQAYADVIVRRGRSVQRLRIGEKPAFHAKLSLPQKLFHGIQRMLPEMPGAA